MLSSFPSLELNSGRAFGIVYFQPLNRNKARLLPWQLRLQGQRDPGSSNLLYTIVGPRLCCGECWLVCWTETLFSKVHGISRPKPQSGSCLIAPWLPPGGWGPLLREALWSLPLLLVLPVKARLPMLLQALHCPPGALTQARQLTQ